MHNHQFVYLILLTLYNSILLMQGCSSDRVPKVVFSNNRHYSDLIAICDWSMLVY